MKRKFIKALKAAGIHYADKDGAKVPVKHLKTYQAINLYYEHGLNEKPNCSENFEKGIDE